MNRRPQATQEHLHVLHTLQQRKPLQTGIPASDEIIYHKETKSDQLTTHTRADTCASNLQMSDHINN